MKTIYKYQLDPMEKNVTMPEGATILHVDSQRDEICIWAEVDTDKPLVTRVFEIYGTGHEIPKDMGFVLKHLGSVKLHQDALIFHVYESTL